MLFEKILQSALLGILQGLTEFLPISSSAHLILLPWLFSWEHLGLTFDVMIHGGTLLAILVYFREEWKEIISGFFRRLRGQPRLNNNNLDLAVLAGTAPAIVIGLVFRSVVEDYLRTPSVIVATLSGFGLLLLWADRRGKGTRSLINAGIKVGVLIGLAQALALVPGVSRSGVTITAGLLLGFSRANSARFSFLLSGPIIALATLDGIVELGGTRDAVIATGWALAVGTLVAFLTGLLCIRYFLRFLQSNTLVVFVLYRLGLAAAILGLLLY